MAHRPTQRVSPNQSVAARRSARAASAPTATLALLVVAQAAVLGCRVLGGGNPEDEIAVGDDLSAVSLQRADGSLTGLADGQGTLLLVFDPDCPHSRKVAAMWRDWLSVGDPGRGRVLALSPAASSSAAAYAREQRWRVDVASIAAATDGNGGHSLTRRTPWVFALDGDGRVLASGHGRKLAEVVREADYKTGGTHHGRDRIARFAVENRQ